MKALILSLGISLCLLANAKAQTVYASEKGGKYHTADCKLSGDASSMDLAAAKKAGKSSCAVCKADEHLKDKTVQCTGKTKEGVQCKRMTSSPSKKCYVHSKA